MAEPSKSSIGQTIQVIQLIILIIGVAGMFTLIGKRDQQLTQVSTDVDKLASATADLAKTQARVSINDAIQERTLEEIKRRIDALESRNR